MTVEAIDHQYLEVHEAGPLLSNPTGGRLVAWAEAAHSAGILGISLAKTSFAPTQFRGKPEECAAAILFGDELGLTPMQSLQAVYVVSGKPGLYARSMLAIVLAAGHEVETVSKTDAKVTVRGRRRGSDQWVEETWTTERARRAGYTSNKKYETDPQAMLLARAQADVCRQIAPDALSGLAYTVEELELSEPAPTARVTRNAAATSTRVKRQELPAAPASDEPDFEESIDTVNAEVIEAKAEEIAETVETQAQPGMTAAQSRMLHASLKQNGYGDRDSGLALCASVIGRAVASTKDLTRDEASAIIDSLAQNVELDDEPSLHDEEVQA